MDFKIDYEINNWAKDNRINNIEFNNILKLGYFIYNEFKLNINPLDGYFKDLKTDISRYNENLYDLKNSIDTLKGITKTSSQKGKFMENYIEEVIKNNFPDDSLEIKSSIGHESDMHLHFNCMNNISIKSF